MALFSVTSQADGTVTGDGSLTGPFTVTSQADGTVLGAGSLTVPFTATSQADGTVTGSGTLTAEKAVTASTSVAVADNLTVTATTNVAVADGLSVTATASMAVADALSLTASLDASIAVQPQVTADTDVLIQGTVEKTADADVAVADAFSLTASLDQLVRTVETVTADTDVAVAETPEVSGDLDVTIQGTEQVTADADVTVADAFSLTASLDQIVFGSETITADTDVAVAGGGSLTASADMAVADGLSVTADLDQIVQVMFTRTTELEMAIIGTGAMLIPIDILIRTSTDLTCSASVAVQGQETLTAGLDLVVETRRPYSLTRLWGDVASRFFSGHTSDTNFFEHFEPHPTATINNDIGSFSEGDRSVTFQTPNTIPTAAAYDKYSLALNASADTSTVGFRLLFDIELLSFGPSNSLLIGGFVGTSDPIADLAAGNLVGLAIEPDKGVVHFRAWAGTNETSRAFATGLPVSRFLNRPLLLTIETTAATGALATFAFHLYDALDSLDVPLIRLDVETSTPPTITHVAMTSLGRRAPELSTVQDPMQVRLRYVDVEPGTGALTTPGYYLAEADAKWRPYWDRPPLTLNRSGTLLLDDHFNTDAGYWRLDSTVASSAITVADGVGSVLGIVYADATGSAAWSDYRVEVDVEGASDAVGTGYWFGVGLYGSGDYSASGNLIAVAINTADNQYSRLRVVSGTPTVANTAFPGTLVPDGRYRLALDVRTDGTDTRINAFIDQTFLFTLLDTNSLASGSPVLVVGSNQTTPVRFDNLLARGGQNDIFVGLSDDGVTATDTRHATLYVDESDPIITVESFTADSPVTVPDTVNPPVIKGSLNTGFSGVALEWSATHAGTWTLRANSTGATNGTEIGSGPYLIAGERVAVGWSFADLPQTDGLYDVTLYLMADSGRPTAKRLGQYLLP